MRTNIQYLEKLQMISVALLITVMIAVASPPAWAQVILDWLNPRFSKPHFFIAYGGFKTGNEGKAMFSKTFTLTSTIAVAAVFPAGIPSAAHAENGLGGYWDFDSGYGSDSNPIVPIWGLRPSLHSKYNDQSGRSASLL